MYASRAQAADHAHRKGIACFGLYREGNLWHIREEAATAAFKSALEFAKTRDYIHHVEQKDHVPVLVITCLREEVLEKVPYKMAPITPSLWDQHAKEIKAMSATSNVPREPRKAGATKMVWDICNANPQATRVELMDLCAKADIHPATAATQYAKWKKSKVL